METSEISCVMLIIYEYWSGIVKVHHLGLPYAFVMIRLGLWVSERKTTEGQFS